MAMIERLAVECFRGIRNLKIDKLNHMNILVGDNNCGKTSVLEALQFFRTSGGKGNVYMIARQREHILWLNANSIYENFICMFPHDGSNLKIQVSGICNDKEISCQINGTQKKILIDTKELDRFRMQEYGDLSENLETDLFDGTFYFRYGQSEKQEKIEINRLSGISGTPMSKEDEFKIIYVAPFEHLRGNVMGQIIKNDEYKSICLKALQLFDPDIEDMMILRSDLGNRPVEYLKHKRLGTMPLSAFREKEKKVLVLSNAIARAAGGILLIDEIETAIHKKYYDDIFGFLESACYTFGVQLFITTHSLEAIDGLLATQKYEEQDSKDRITVITLKREGGNTYSRVLAGREVAYDRDAFGFEVRL